MTARKSDVESTKSGDGKALPASTGSAWLHIDSAPKDGKLIDIWTTSYGRVTDAKWSSKHESWVAYGWGEFDRDSWAKLNTVATHWMPIPFPPNSAIRCHSDDSTTIKTTTI